jgi:hypothetical protein
MVVTAAEKEATKLASLLEAGGGAREAVVGQCMEMEEEVVVVVAGLVGEVVAVRVMAPAVAVAVATNEVVDISSEAVVFRRARMAGLF